MWFLRWCWVCVYSKVCCPRKKNHQRVEKNWVKKHQINNSQSHSTYISRFTHMHTLSHCWYGGFWWMTMKTVYNDMRCKEPNSVVCTVWSSSSGHRKLTLCVWAKKLEKYEWNYNVFAFANEIPQGSQAIIISTALFSSADGMNWWYYSPVCIAIPCCWWIFPARKGSPQLRIIMLST